MPDVTYENYLETLKDNLNTEFGGSTMEVVLGPGRKSYTGKIIHVIPGPPVIHFEPTGGRSKTHRVFRPWYHAKIHGFVYITDPAGAGPLGGVTGKDGILKMMWDVYEHLSGNFLELSQIREAIVEWANPAIQDVVIVDGQEEYYAAAGGLLHKIRLKEYEAEEQQASCPAISNVLGSVTDTTITVTFDTDKRGTSLIRYGSNPNNLDTDTSELTDLVTSHTVTIIGLSPGQTIYFKPRSKSETGLWGTTPDIYYAQTDSAPGMGDGKDPQPYNA